MVEVGSRRDFVRGQYRVGATLGAVTAFAQGLHMHPERRIARGKLEVAGPLVDGGLTRVGQVRYLC